MSTRTSAPNAPWACRATQKVVVVNGSHELLQRLESLLDAGHYDIVFAANLEHAYSEIKKNRPDLVILCLDLDNPVGFQVLSMLNLDPDTARIPLLTCTTDDDLERARPEPDDDGPGSEVPTSPLALRLN
jgi:PleD family two-component response regulator